MYSIGKFSKLTGINIKTLVWFDNIGLLKPEMVNPENGYRYYGDDSFKKVADIKYFQSMGFSLQEIANISKEIIADKIEELRKKINFIYANIDLLKALKEEKMENLSIFGFSDTLIQGKWNYQKTTTSFNDVIDVYAHGRKQDFMPEKLFFGAGNKGTDLDDVFSYNSSGFTIKSENGWMREFWYFLLDYNSTLVLYQKPREVDKLDTRIKFHVYKRYGQDKYSEADIMTLYRKYNDGIFTQLFDFNKALIGKWQFYDKIDERKIEDYTGKIDVTDNYSRRFFIPSMYETIEIDENKKVSVMEDGKSVEFKGSNPPVILTRENTMCRIESCGKSNEEFLLEEIRTYRKFKGIYKKVGDDEYLFINLDTNPDLYEKYYVFKKIK